MGGPLPTGEAVRRNKPTIPTTQLPASGRKDSAPSCPYDLGPLGRKWWTWAWLTPQAAGWSDGDAYFVARRAAMEDLEPEETATALRREMREMDDRLGLSPKGLAALRWKIIDDAEEVKPAATGGRNLLLVDRAG